MNTHDSGTAVVTGSSSGIGMAVAQLFLQRGGVFMVWTNRPVTGLPSAMPITI